MTRNTSLPYLASHVGEDIEAFCNAHNKFALELKQLSPGRFRGYSLMLTLPGCILIRVSASLRLAASLRAPPGATLLFPLDDREAWIQGRLCGPRQQVASLGNHDAFAVLPAGFTCLVVVLPLDELAKRFDVQRGERFIGALRHIENVCVDEQSKHAVTARIRDIFHGIENAREPLGPAVLREHSNSILELLDDYLTRHAALAPVRRSNHERILQRALGLIVALPGRVFTLDDIARAVFASKRAVQYAFSSILDMSPMRFQKLCRLNQVRSDLLGTQHARKFCSVLASHGFSNAGRMCREYSALFGERPADTLRQRRAVVPEDINWSSRPS
ncbi:MAG: helix-turn-helix domain-containing protein [Gammaproteobacteria bacterium]